MRQFLGKFLFLLLSFQSIHIKITLLVAAFSVEISMLNSNFTATLFSPLKINISGTSGRKLPNQSLAKLPSSIFWKLLQLHLHPLIRYCCISNKNYSDLIFAWSWFDVFDILALWQICPISVKHNKNMGFDIIARKRKGAEKWKWSKMFVEKKKLTSQSCFWKGHRKEKYFHLQTFKLKKKTYLKAEVLHVNFF